MRNSILALLIIILASSCQDQNIKALTDRINILERENVKLADSLNRSTYLKVMSTELVGIPDKNKLTPNQPNRFTFILTTRQEFPAYNVYLITREDDEEIRELLYENYKESRFEFNFIPKDATEKSFELLAQFDLDSITVNIPAVVDMGLIE